MNAPTKYRKRPVEVCAMPLLQTNVDDVLAWINAAAEEGAPLAWVAGRGIKIATLEGVMSACWGSYVIRGVAGEFYACDPVIFAKTYEEVL